MEVSGREPDEEQRRRAETDAEGSRTVADRPSSLRPPAHGPTSSAKGSRPTGIATGGRGQQALHADEVERARGMGLLLGLLCVTAVGWFPILGGEPWVRDAAIAAMLWLGAVSLYVWRRAKPGPRYRFQFRLFVGSAVICSGVIMYHIGIFSPAPIAVTLGISFFGTAADRVWAVGCCVVASTIYSTTALLIGVGAIPDLGLITGPQSPMIVAFACVMVPIVFAGTLRQALLSRRTSTQAMTQVEHAVREVQARDAQLAEANLDLEKALEVGAAGRIGRHTGRTAGTWVLGDVIGRGAMGEVYAADDHAGGSAAVKTLMATADPEQLIRFRREAEIAMSLRAPGLVSVFEIGALDNAVPYLVMELLNGHDLAWHLRKTRVLPIDEAIRLCDQVAAALQVAHAAGIVHRDIKPQNLMLHEPVSGGAPAWKILDFGVSKLQDSGNTLTQNMVIGTPGYMSPEQARGLPADSRSDLFALGAVLYRALTGQPPFRGNDTPSIMFDVVYRGPRRPTDLSPALPADVDCLLAIALAKDPAARFATAKELAEAFVTVANNDLSRELRARGRALIADLPWGGRVPDAAG